MIILLYLGLGAFAGLAAGLFGIGGGLVIVPTLIYAFHYQGVAPEVLTHLAVGTSLATIVITSISSVRGHHLAGAIRWPIFWSLTPGILVGGYFGVRFAASLSGPALQLAIGVFAIIIAAQMGFGMRPAPHRDLPGRLPLLAVGGIIGSVSAIFGIGGGSLTVPYLSWCNVRVQQAIATAAACGLPIALSGGLVNIWQGWGNEQLPEWSSGFVYWPAFLGIILSSAVCARFGARLAHSLPADRLKQIFALFLLVVGCQFIYKALG
ncbi:MAG: sulfite exporter TauE/SafE family protein [Pseudomonadales bacterium]